MDGLAFAAFLAALPDEDRARWTGDAARDELERHWVAGRAAWPELALDPAHFGAEVARRLDREATADDLGRLRGSDLYLAIACAGGDARAIASCERACFDIIEVVAARMRAPAELAADVRADLRRILFVSEPDRRAATLSYGGRGDLRAYVGVMATRALLRAINRDRRSVPLDDTAILDRLATATDPELGALRARYSDDVRRALADALAALDDRGRAILRYHLVDGLGLDELGELFQVHRTTTFRWLQRARADLGDRIRDLLAARLRVPTDEVDSIVRLVQSRIEVSIERLLAEP